MAYGGGAPLPCCLLQQTDPAPVGVRRVGALKTGATVYFVLHPGAKFGAIIGVEPPFTQTGRSPYLYDWISTGSGTSPAVDPATAFDIAARDPLLADFAAGAPLDETAAGEYGLIAPGGPMWFADDVMAFLRADDNCGLWAFVLDQLLRVHGHNLQIRSMLAEIAHYDDQDELSGYEGSTPYAYEALGLLAPGPAGKRTPVDEVQLATPEVGETDLVDPDQVRFDRLRRYTGFLGQAFRTILALPPDTDLKTYRGDLDVAGVFDESLSLSGDYRLASARGLSFLHVPLFPVPGRVASPADPGGDDRATGYVPGGADQKYAADPKGELPVGPGPALFAEDEAAFALWRAGHPFHYHKLDFKTAAPGEGAGTAEVPADYGVLSDRQYTERPEPSVRKVDHRHDAAYHPTVSGWKTLPDGTALFWGPAGEEIRMAGGSIEISCPGDIILRPGRNLIGMAGRDAIVRSKNNVELSASEEDVRVKAGRHAEVLAGNLGVGMLLLESRGEGDDVDFTGVGSDVFASGVIIKATGRAAVLAETVYVRSGATADGGIVLDAAAGQGPVSVYASDLSRFVGAAFDFFVSGGVVTDVNAYSADTILFSGGLEVTDSTVIGGSLVTGGSIAVADGHIATSDAASFDGKVGELRDESLDSVRAAVAQPADSAKGQRETGNAALAGRITDPFLADGRLASKDVLSRVGFSFRTTQQYGTGDYVLYESRWAQRARQAGKTTGVWTEDPVRAGADETYPYPGKDAWTGPSYRTADSALYDVGTGKAKPFGTPYEEATYPVPDESAPDGSYPVI